ncbi:hypothetical protein A2160_02480 [Candidatus Beckwithbacteria bacterium RBG_13_42_9]|uniref:Glycosyltransferase 2-like domain-containing protein n=1 Tax=Candidatus Beckwithbacteria bacterium RBG_13_42_9 TaxID=1797457 RepID=A0A1F5E7S4_9BACT|nr:MAG: hypothetical protein A2160_02480 [Candidatus Beckwithbacteria bacterium RBG_13_42_9]
MGSKAELIIVDDGSSDTTPQEVNPKLAHLISHKVNQGKGMAMKTGIKEAHGDVILFLGGDGQDDPQDIPKLLKAIDRGADFVIGSRFVAKNSKASVEPLNLVGNKIITLIFNLLFGVKITDTQAEFKAILSKYLKKWRLESSRYEIETELIIKAVRKKLKIVEVSTKRFSRKHGKSHLYQIPLGRVKFALRALSIIVKGFFLW